MLRHRRANQRDAGATAAIVHCQLELAHSIMYIGLMRDAPLLPSVGHTRLHKMWPSPHFDLLNVWFRWIEPLIDCSREESEIYCSNGRRNLLLIDNCYYYSRLRGFIAWLLILALRYWRIYSGRIIIINELLL